MPTASATVVRPGLVGPVPPCGVFASVLVLGWVVGGVLVSLARPGLNFFLICPSSGDLGIMMMDSQLVVMIRIKITPDGCGPLEMGLMRACVC